MNYTVYKTPEPINQPAFDPFLEKMPPSKQPIDPETRARFRIDLSPSYFFVIT